ncbi:hypothetical protein BTJ68_08961 [Hortaea werneckii EXF-2000]|uniref:Glutamine amidotransferase type-2 domain-containing protein n=1 Tax=Hortaea werneckii EXF-2000 TaxID=1157616 RepID=A0A1Z5T5C3_HORWE|nr:hypothetical protein BTJ68_08961 [Hortaea werneckii EXF-2000]
MCGIFCSVSCREPICPSPTLQELLQQRGPDAIGDLVVQIPRKQHETPTNQHIKFYSSVLSLRGDNTVRQPYRGQHHSESTLCWNGEAWEISGQSPNGNDTELISDLLRTALAGKIADDAGSRAETVSRIATEVANKLSRVAGPYAFVAYDHDLGVLCFGRDFLGRRSLLTRVTEDGDFLLSSVSDSPESSGWSEVEADGVYCVDLQRTADSGLIGDETRLGRYPVMRIPYRFTDDDPLENHSSVIPHLSLNKHSPSSWEPLRSSAAPVSRLHELLHASTSQRILNIPDHPGLRDAPVDEHAAARLAILFSGGLDCTVLARLAHDILPTIRKHRSTQRRLPEPPDPQVNRAWKRQPDGIRALSGPHHRKSRPRRTPESLPRPALEVHRNQHPLRRSDAPPPAHHQPHAPAQHRNGPQHLLRPLLRRARHGRPDIRRAHRHNTTLHHHNHRCEGLALGSRRRRAFRWLSAPHDCVHSTRFPGTAGRTRARCGAVGETESGA